jgi:hypothetical protein
MLYCGILPDELLAALGNFEHNLSADFYVALRTELRVLFTQDKSIHWLAH